MYKCIDISYDDQNASVRDCSKLEYTLTIAERRNYGGGGGGEDTAINIRSSFAVGNLSSINFFCLNEDYCYSFVAKLFSYHAKSFRNYCPPPPNARHYFENTHMYSITAFGFNQFTGFNSQWFLSTQKYAMKKPAQSGGHAL